MKREAEAINVFLDAGVTQVAQADQRDAEERRKARVAKIGTTFVGTPSREAFVVSFQG